ncbi:hypothetical protein MXB_3243 [Myxobolus squamalis]|nr:hypothetical protein MXB_3243 [Myxobolus squamalis]
MRYTGKYLKASSYFIYLFVLTCFGEQENQEIVENFKNKTVVKILLYRSFYGKKLMPDLESSSCQTFHQFVIIRSNNIVNFDIVILHFTEHNLFMKNYLKTNSSTKKIMILFTYVSFDKLYLGTASFCKNTI